MEFVQQISNFKSILTTTYRLSYLLLGCLYLASITIIYFTISQNIAFIGLLIPLSILFIVLCIKYPKLWLNFIALSFGYFFVDKGDTITTSDVIVGAIYLGTLVTWFFWYLIVRREKLLRNVADWMILAFFIFLIFNYIICYFINLDFLNWLRQYLLLMNVLFYFPIRYHIKTKKELMIFLLIVAISVFFTEIYHFMVYRSRALVNTFYAYELESSSRINLTLFSATAIFAIMISLFQNKFFKRILFFSFAAITIIALITTFARTFWMILLINVVISLFYISGKQRIRLTMYILLISFTFIGASVLVLKNNSKLIFTIVENRLKSVSKGKQDVSLLSRLKEYESVFKYIKQNPFTGTGLGNTFRFINPIGLTTAHTYHVHNGYLFFLFHIGLPTFLFFLIPLIYYLLKTHFYIIKCNDPFFKPLLIGSLCSLIVIFLSDLSTQQFIQRDCVMVIAISIAIVGVYQNHLLSLENNTGKNDTILIPNT